MHGNNWGQGRFSLVVAMSVCLSVGVGVCPITIDSWLHPKDWSFSLFDKIDFVNVFSLFLVLKDIQIAWLFQKLQQI